MKIIKTEIGYPISNKKHSLRFGDRFHVKLTVSKRLYTETPVRPIVWHLLKSPIQELRTIDGRDKETWR